MPSRFTVWSFTDTKNPANCRQLAGRVRTEIADCVTEIPNGKYGKSVQLFDLGAFDFFCRRGLCYLRFHLSIPD